MLTSTQQYKDSATILKMMIGEKAYYLPQADLSSFENINDINQQDKPKAAVASILYNNKTVPVYCLSANLELLDVIDPKRKVCIVCQYRDQYFALLIDQIEKLDYQMLRIEPVPDVMCSDEQNNASAIDSLLLYKDADNITNMGLLLRDYSLNTFLQASNGHCNK